MRSILRARREARRVLEQAKVRTVPVPLSKLVGQYPAEIVFRAMSEEISGMLVPIEDSSWVIVVNEGHPEVRQRFTIAHELGHLILHGYKAPHADSNRSFKIRHRDKKSADGSVLEEIEANQFAAELLMPEDILLRKLRDEGIDYAPTEEDSERIAKLAREFKVSLQALTIRLSTILL